MLIPNNLDREHWVLARVDFRKNKVWIFDSLLTFRVDRRYKLEYVDFYNIRPELRSTNPWKVITVKSVPQQKPGIGDCDVFLLMFTIYLMFMLKLEFNGSYREYFRKKITVDIFNDDIVL